MTGRISALDYVVRNWPTHGDPVLEETRQDALRELDELYGKLRGGPEQTRKVSRNLTLRFGMAAALLYRGIMIYSLPDGSTLIFGEGDQEYPFLGLPEAQAFVDTTFELSGRLIGSLV